MSRVTFQAALESGEGRASFFVGCVGSSGVAVNGDSTCRSTDEQLTGDWKAVEIALDPNGIEPVDTLVGGFGWSMNLSDGILPKVLYLDDIVFE